MLSQWCHTFVPAMQGSHHQWHCAPDPCLKGAGPKDKVFFQVSSSLAGPNVPGMLSVGCREEGTLCKHRYSKLGFSFSNDLLFVIHEGCATAVQYPVSEINKAINKIMALFCTFTITEVRKWYKKKEGGYVHISSITKKHNLIPAMKYSIHNYLTKHLMHNISLVNKKTLTVPDTTRDKNKTHKQEEKTENNNNSNNNDNDG